jgi:LPS-assembly lipoprotein
VPLARGPDDEGIGGAVAAPAGGTAPVLPRRRAVALMIAFTGLGTANLAGCGFTLRGSVDLPFRRIALTGFAPRSPLGEELRRTLSAQVEVVPTPAQAEVVFQVLNEARERSVAASTAFGQVRELQLRVRLQFRVTAPDGRELATASELLQQRDLSYAEEVALGKDQEEAELFREMQSDVVAQVLRRLAALRP